MFQFQGCADVWNKTAVKHCSSCRWSALFHESAHPWNWNKTLLSTVGPLKRSPDRQQFCFISVLFHHVRRALKIQSLIGWCVCVSVCRTSATSTGLASGRRGTSTSLSTHSPSTTCRSTSCVSSRSQTPGSVSVRTVFDLSSSYHSHQCQRHYETNSQKKSGPN